MPNEDKRYSVERWRGDALQASQMSVGVCQDTDMAMVGIDMVAQDGSVFAHGHFDVATAVTFAEHLAEVIAEAMGHAD